MYQFSYSEVADEASSTMRAQERAAIDRILAMLRAAEGKPAGSAETVEALYYLRRLWSIWLTDLASDENDLPEATRAGLISIGIWVNKEIDLVQSGARTTLSGLIEINQLIRDGLK
jgi:flagellar protein FlaF